MPNICYNFSFREAKLDLLDLFVKLNEWPKPVSQSHHRVTTRDSSCQTIEGKFLSEKRRKFSFFNIFFHV